MSIMPLGTAVYGDTAGDSGDSSVQAVWLLEGPPGHQCKDRNIWNSPQDNSVLADTCMEGPWGFRGWDRTRLKRL